MSNHLQLVVPLSSLLAVVSVAAADETVVNQNSGSRIVTSADTSNYRPVINTLPAPDVSNIVLDTVATPNSNAMGHGGLAIQSATRAYGSFGIPYTTTRVQDGAGPATGATSTNRLSTTYPYRAIGRLNITTTGSFCSASVIRKGVIVTAAHCIQPFGAGSSIYLGWQFVPGHYGPTGATAAQIAPYGTWTWSAVTRPASWASGTDTGSGSARNNDLAVIALAKNASGKFIGDVVGYLGYGWNNYSFVTSAKTGNLNTAAVSTLGYPALMDGGKIMQRSDGPAYTTTVSGAKQIWQGTNFTGGSSGGPWVVNFRTASAVLSGGAVAGSQSLMSVIGVTSWGTSDPNVPKDNYSSQFAQNVQYPNASYGTYGGGNIGSLLNTLCSAAAPEGGTYASQGYCN